jgi:hypothetical protein
MPLTGKGTEIMGAMQKQYGEKKGKEVFYASANKGTIKGVHDRGDDCRAYYDACRRGDAVAMGAHSAGMRRR